MAQLASLETVVSFEPCHAKIAHFELEILVVFCIPHAQRVGGGLEGGLLGTKKRGVGKGKAGKRAAFAEGTGECVLLVGEHEPRDALHPRARLEVARGAEVHSHANQRGLLGFPRVMGPCAGEVVSLVREAYKNLLARYVGRLPLVVCDGKRAVRQVYAARLVRPP